MHTKSVKLVLTILLAALGYFIVSQFIDSLSGFYRDPQLILSPANLWTIVVLAIFLSLWVYGLIKVIESLYNQFRYGTGAEQKIKLLDRELHSYKIFLDVAEKEFMKRRISKQTLDDIQRIAGKKMVEVKAKKKEMAEEDGSPPKLAEPPDE